jgi:hypothetical protein
MINGGQVHFQSTKMETILVFLHNLIKVEIILGNFSFVLIARYIDIILTN